MSALGSQHWLLRMLRPHWPLWSVFGLLILLEAVARLATPLYYKFIFDRVLPARDQHLLLLALGGMLGVIAIMTVTELAESLLGSSLGTRTVNELRAALFERLQQLPLDDPSGARSGDLVTRFTSDAGTIGRLLTLSLDKVIANAFVAILSAVALFVLEWRLAAFAALVLTLAVVLPKSLGARTIAADTDRRRDEDRISSEVSETLAGRRVIRAFSLEAYASRRFAAALATAFTSTRRAALLTANLDKILGLTLLVGQILIVALGTYLVTVGLLTAGGLVGFVGLLLNVSAGIANVTAFVPDLVQSTSAATRIDEFLDQRSAPADPEGATGAVRVRDGIDFRGVGFRYGDAVILNDISFSIRAGESVAFVGRSGSGKSTMVNLLMRFSDPTDGAIEIDGRDVRTIAPAAVRAQIGAVFQSTFLFHATIRENIRLGRLAASDEDVERAARSAMIHEAILELPLGYDTTIGESGVALSGGQQQRIALARAIVREPALLIMDEATSGLDPATEAAVNETLRTLERGRTSITVTHRLASVVGMNRIFVFEKGKIAEAGTHDELMAARGPFHAMWQKQCSFSVDGSGKHARLDGLFLRTIPVFAALDDEQLDALADKFESELYDGGVNLIEQGAVGDRLYVIVRGRVEVVVGSTVVGILEDGDVFGEIALLADVPRTATVRTLERALLLALRRDQFNAFLDAAPGVRAAFERVMRDRLENAAFHATT